MQHHAPLEDRPVLHHILRLPEGYQLERRHVFFKEIYRNINRHETQDFDLSGVIHDVHDMRARIREFSERVRAGEYRSVTGKPFTNLLVVGIGGYTSGPELVVSALRLDQDASRGAQGHNIRFLTNVDPHSFKICTADLDPSETLVIISNKTFTETECMVNARAVKQWLTNKMPNYDEKDVVARHIIAISSNATRCAQFGIAKENTFLLWDWVIGRFSLCSVVGLLPLSIHFSYEFMLSFLDGCHDMDEHYFKAPLRDNLPVILALLGVWNSTFLGHSTCAILPYSDALTRFPAHVQQIDMGSNGKRVASDGTPLLHRSAVVTFGEAGTVCQNSFFQLIHQGRVVPAEFIGFMECQSELDTGTPIDSVSSHDELMSYFFSQPDALAYGKTLMDLVQEGAPEPLREHMVFQGNRPSTSILLTRLDAFALGQLISLYEHRTATQGFIWGINSFDQFGLELGRSLAKSVRAQLSASRKTGASVQGFNYSTSSLLDHYLSDARLDQGAL
jgi:glucose-6-phosphate isomerase